jgi:anti-sigma-K factor RskA
MQKNECSFVCDQFTDYQENTLAADIRERVEAHLAVCQTCTKLYQELAQTLNHLHQLPPVQTSPSFTDDLMSRIHADSQTGIWHRITESGYHRWAGYAVAAGLVLALGLNMWFDPIPANSPQKVRIYAESPQTPEVRKPDLAEQVDSTAPSPMDSLQLSPGTINSGTQPLQLVNGTH